MLNNQKKEIHQFRDIHPGSRHATILSYFIKWEQILLDDDFYPY